MPGKSRYSVDVLIKEIEKLHKNGLNAIALFPVIDSKKKSKDAKEAYNQKGLVQTAVRTIKKNTLTLELLRMLH